MSAWSWPRRYLTGHLVGRIFSYTSSEEVAVRRTRAKGAISNVIAERVFQRADGKEARAIVGRPHKAKRGWVCEFQVRGVAHSKVYKLPGEDSLEALQMALAMMAIQVESYQKEHGLTFLGEPFLLMMKPDFEAMMKEIEASPDYPKWRHVLDGVWDEPSVSGDRPRS